MAEQLPNPNDIANDTLGSATDAAQGAIDSVTDQIPDIPNPLDLVPDIPNPADLIPEIPKIPTIAGLIGLLPLPQFRKPKPVQVPPPPQPKKLQKETAVPKVPKEPLPVSTQVLPSQQSSYDSLVSQGYTRVSNSDNQYQSEYVFSVGGRINLIGMEKEGEDVFAVIFDDGGVVIRNYRTK